ncbi:MAG: hypothetical protein WCQ95_10500 [Bacteroidota bacterium]
MISRAESALSQGVSDRSVVMFAAWSWVLKSCRDASCSSISLGRWICYDGDGWMCMLWVA